MSPDLSTAAHAPVVQAHGARAQGRLVGAFGLAEAAAGCHRAVAGSSEPCCRLLEQAEHRTRPRPAQVGRQAQARGRRGRWSCSCDGVPIRVDRDRNAAQAQRAWFAEGHALEPAAAAPASGCGPSRPASCSGSARRRGAALSGVSGSRLAADAGLQQRAVRVVMVDAAPAAALGRGAQEAEAVAALDTAERRDMEDLVGAAARAPRPGASSR